MRKKICFIVPHLKAGGQERVVAELANYFNGNKSIDVTILLFTKAPIHFSLNREITVLEPDFHSDSPNKAILAIKAIFFIRRTIKRITPDIILSFGEIWNSLVLISCLFIKSEKFVSDRCRPSLKLHILHRILRRVLYPSAKGIIAQTELAGQAMFNKIKHPNIVVIGNPIRKISGANQFRENIILNVGRFVSDKQQDLLIRIFSEIEKDNWILMLVGEGHLLERCKILAGELGIADKVNFTGQVENIDNYYLKSKIFAFTSRSEGFPNVLGEAQSAGLPVITFDFEAGARELVKDSVSGYIIPEGRIDDYKAALTKLMNDEKLRLTFSENAATSILEFRSTDICEKFYSFLTGLNITEN